MNNQIFQWNRFVAALRKEVVENWRMLLFSIIGIYSVSVLFMILGNLMTSGSMDTEPVRLLPYNFAYLLFSFGGIIFASIAFHGLKSKAGRIELLTSPSSTLEKFLVNVIIYVLGFIIVCPILLQLADLTRIACLMPWEGNNLHVPGPINFLATINEFAHQNDYLWSNEFSHQLTTAMYISILAGPAMYLLGSIIWPRLSFLKTFAATYAIETILVVLFMIGVSIFSDMRTVAQWVYDHLQSGSIMLGMTIFAIVQLVFFFALAWWLWKRKDVISLKWWS